MFIGPKDRKLLAQDEYAALGYSEVIDYGKYLGWLVKLFLILLSFFQSI